MSGEMRRVGQLLRDTEGKGPVRLVTGVTTSASADRRVSVEVAGQIVTAVIPGSFREPLAAGVGVSLSIQGAIYMLADVYDGMPTPVVAAAVEPVDLVAVGPEGFVEEGYDTDGFTSQDYQNAYYGEACAYHIRRNAGLQNDDHAKLMEVIELLNGLRDAAVAQGRAS